MLTGLGERGIYGENRNGNHAWDFCAEPNSPTPSGNLSVFQIFDDSNVKAMLLVSIGGPAYDVSKPYFESSDVQTHIPDIYGCCHAVLSYLYGGYTTGLNTNQLAWVYNITVELKERQMKIRPLIVAYMHQYHSICSV